MKHVTKIAVTQVLAEGPASIKEISGKTGLANGTITRALAELGAISDGYYGAKWTITESALQEFTKSRKLPGMRSLKVNDSDEGIIVSYTDIPIYKYNRSRHKVADALVALEIKPKGDPKNYALQITDLAGNLASLAHQLTEAADDPAWFTTLGGVEPSTDEE